MTDSLAAKQVYSANKARSIAQAPLSPMCSTLDFLDDSGGRMRLTEEIPVYTWILGLGYRVFGEHEWLGRLLSIAGTLTAIAAFHGLFRREYGSRIALPATLLFAVCPLLVFYGRAVLPDPWMLACMLLSALCYRRHLDGEGGTWLAAAALAGLLAAAFKYYGLIVLLPLADMTRRTLGWRACLRWRFLALTAAMTLPIAVWMAAVFFRTPNPLRSGWMAGPVYPYTIIQAPAVLLDPHLYTTWFSRFLLRDCGPVTAAMIVAGAIAAGRGRARPGSAVVWTVMGMIFYVLFGPKLRDHDYYELMMLPAAAVWAGLGWSAISVRPVWGRRLAGALLVAAVIVQSPWVMGSLFRLDRGKSIVAERLRQFCPPGARVVAIGPGIELPVIVHYSEREGWALHSKALPDDWVPQFTRYRSLGARCAALYLDNKATAAQRDSYRRLVGACRTLEHRSGAWSRTGGRCEYFILDISTFPARRELLSSVPLDAR